MGGCQKIGPWRHIQAVWFSKNIDFQKNSLGPILWRGQVYKSIVHIYLSMYLTLLTLNLREVWWLASQWGEALSCCVWGQPLYFTLLYSTLLYCTVLYHTVLYHTILYCTNETRESKIWCHALHQVLESNWALFVIVSVLNCNNPNPISKLFHLCFCLSVCVSQIFCFTNLS